MSSKKRVVKEPLIVRENFQVSTALARFIETVSEISGMSKANLLRRSVLYYSEHILINEPQIKRALQVYKRALSIYIP